MSWMKKITGKFGAKQTNNMQPNFNYFPTGKWVFICVAAIIISGCGMMKPPKKVFEAYTPSNPPDYSQSYTWAALPETEDEADKTPPGVAGQAQESARVDVFFIHPTTFMGGVAWNADVRDKEINAKTDTKAIRHQASVFNQSCKVYAPRYRQMAFGGFFTEDRQSEIKALNLAYSDVRRAFKYYLENYNQGRPVIIASHSQGSVHGIRLLKEFFDGKPLQEKLVAGWLVGWPFPADTLQFIPACQTPEETGCVMSWNTWKKQTLPKDEEDRAFYAGALITNPLTWTTDTAYAPKSLHTGFLYANYKKIRANRQDAQAKPEEGLLWTNKPLPFIPTRNYHVGDYNLFWMNIRENVEKRVSAYLQEHATTEGR